MVLTISGGSSTLDLTELIRQNGLTIRKQDLESGITTMDGKTHRGKIVSKTVIEVSCIPMLSANLLALMSLLENEYLSVFFTDPAIGNRSAQMFVKERPASLLVHYSNGREYWDGISFRLEET